VLNFVDITVHRQAEELRRRTAFLEEQTRILGLANVFIFGLDGRITIWNQGCERLYGYSREEAVGRIAHELLGTVFSLPLAEIKAQLLRTGAWDGELSHVKRDGERITVASRWVLHRNEAGEPSAILEANHDISEHTRAEALRQADRRKDEFLAMLAHELRNPLAAMQSSFELLSDSGDDGESMRLARGVMDRQLKLLIRLVDDLLDIERLARGKITLRKERIDVAAVVEDALETTRPLIETYNHTLAVSLPTAPLYVAGDRSRLAQVLANLLHNAAKYTPPGGRIELSVSAEDKAAVMRVRDNGIGIPAEVVPHIFEYFAQEAPSPESNRRGLGVGLALARQLVELHEGAIQAESGGRGKGSEFTVRIPLTATPPVDAVAAGVAPNGPAHASITPRKLLVIDDDHDVADALAGLLRNSGHQVWTAYSGQSGVQAALKYQPEVALIDIAMPDMDGYETARRLREQLPGILLIAVTGLVQKSDRVRDAGFNYHVAKPASASQIEDLLAAARLPSA
jgi:two-component system CheB/CheR fusion protein